MLKRTGIVLAILLATLLPGCYTFSGSSLPSHLKTVDIPLFANQSLQSDIADAVTNALSSQVVQGNLLRVVGHDGDATITGTIVSYVNTPYTFSASDTRQVSVNQYVVRITAQVEFMDNKKGTPIFKGPVTGEGVYDLSNQTEETGKQLAISQLVSRILQNSVQGW